MRGWEAKREREAEKEISGPGRLPAAGCVQEPVRSSVLRRLRGEGKGEALRDLLAGAQQPLPGT